MPDSITTSRKNERYCHNNNINNNGFYINSGTVHQHLLHLENPPQQEQSNSSTVQQQHHGCNANTYSNHINSGNVHLKYGNIGSYNKNNRYNRNNNHNLDSSCFSINVTN